MGRLPEHRRAVTGRTWSQAWNPADMDPVQAYPAESTAERIAGVVLAVVIGILGAAALIHWWSS